MFSIYNSIYSCSVLFVRSNLSRNKGKVIAKPSLILSSSLVEQVTRKDKRQMHHALFFFRIVAPTVAPERFSPHDFVPRRAAVASSPNGFSKNSLRDTRVG